MYQAKLHGSDTYTLFTDAMNEAAQERLAIEQGLRTGLIEDRFSVFYQPIVELGSGRTTMYEALLRWNHPKRGCVAPVNFIDVVKIDRSFVKDLSSGSVSETIVCAVVSMARALDFYVVAEGVETEAELEVVRQSQCDGAQGYLLGAPQPACDV